MQYHTHIDCTLHKYVHMHTAWEDVLILTHSKAVDSRDCEACSGQLLVDILHAVDEVLQQCQLEGEKGRKGENKERSLLLVFYANREDNYPPLITLNQDNIRAHHSRDKLV